MAIMNNIAMFGFIVVVWILYSMMSPRKAMVASMLAGSMFLPNYGWQVSIIRQYDKSTAVSFAVLITMLLIDPARFTKIRFSKVDLPMILWCICPFFSSLSNGLGVYDGLAETVSQAFYWGLPYFIGRIYFTDSWALNDLSWGLFVAGLILAPFCLVEIAHGPLFHAKVYGFYPHNYWEMFRFGGWRPSVFFIHGLWLGWFMTVAAFAGLVLLWAKQPRSLISMPMWCWSLGLVVVTLFCKSTGALAILGMGAAVLCAGRWRRWVMVGLLVAPIFYVGVRVTGMWDGGQLVSAAGNLGDGRDDSLQWRLNLENLIIAKAMDKPLLGWGGWGRSVEGTGAWTEGIWTMEIGRHGLFGVAMWLLAGLVPAAVCYSRYKYTFERITPANAGLFTILVLAPLWIIYGLTVVDFSPYNTMIIGALAGIATAPQEALVPRLKQQQMRYQTVSKLPRGRVPMPARELTSSSLPRR